MSFVVYFLFVVCPPPPALQLQKELRQQEEESDVALRAQQEEAESVRNGLQQQLAECRQEIRELGVLRAEMAAKEEAIEKLLREKEQLASKLGLSEHQCAVLKAGVGVAKEEWGGGEVIERLVKEKEDLCSRLGRVEHQCGLLRAELAARSRREREERDGGREEGEGGGQPQSQDQESAILRKQYGKKRSLILEEYLHLFFPICSPLTLIHTHTYIRTRSYAQTCRCEERVGGC